MKKTLLLLICLIGISSSNLWAQKENQRRRQHFAPDAPIVKIVNMSQLPYIVNTAVEIGVFEALDGKSLTVKEITEALKTRQSVTNALLIVLDAADLLDFNHGKYSLSPAAASSLVESADGNQIDWLSKNVVSGTGPMEDLKASLTGKLERPQPHHGAGSAWSQKEWLIASKKRVKEGRQTAPEFIESLPEFDNFRKMIDFAGSIGYYSFPLLDKNPKLKAYVYDLPNVCEIGREVQKDEKNYDRATFCGFDMRNNDPIGEGYDLFFVSNVLYGQRSKEELVDFFKKANKAMVKGGVLVSNHWTNNRRNDGYLSFTISTLQQSLHGRPVHFIQENILKEALKEAGFDNFTVKITNKEAANPVLLIAARKVK